MHSITVRRAVKARKSLSGRVYCTPEEARTPLASTVSLRASRDYRFLLPTFSLATWAMMDRASSTSSLLMP